MKVRRVLVTAGIFPPDIGGPATYAQTLLASRPLEGIELTLLNFSSLLRIPRGLRHLWFLVQVLIHGRKADVFLALDPVSVGLPTLFAAWILGRPFVLRIGGDYAWEQSVERLGVEDDLNRFLDSRYGWRVELLKGIERMVARRAARVIVTDRYMQGVLEKWKVRPDKVVIITNAFDVSGIRVTRDEARRMLHLRGPLVVSMGRLLRWKGFAKLIDVVASLRSDFPDVSLAIVGSGPQAGDLANSVKEADLDQTVLLPGGLPHDRALLYLKAADVFVLNSAGEGMSHSILEAMALGTPVVATRAGGNPDLIEHGKSGWLVAPHDEADLRSAIRELLKDPERAALLASGASQSLGRFDKGRMVRETISVLRSVA